MLKINKTICIPTLEKNADKQIKDIKDNLYYKDVEVFASCINQSAAKNRNHCLDKAIGDIIIMLDDDITGFFPGWDKALIKPLEDNSVSIVAARLTKIDGANAPMMYQGTKFNIVPAGCIAFRKTGVRFDEGYGVGFEDTDFCLQMEQAFPNKHTIINEDCRLIHSRIIDRRKDSYKSRRYFFNKWGWVHYPKEVNKTIIYYTSNREKESFENKVRENILRVKGNMPIISVSQKPIDFGKNICVGDVGHNYQNAFKQALIGCEATKTEYVVMTESDCLYPSKGYFDFQPTDLNVIYSYDNVWMLWDKENRTRFYKHGTTGGSIILGRKLYIKLLKEKIKGIKSFDKPNLKWEFFHRDSPIINIKTRNGISFGTALTKGVRPKKSFPYWGTVEDVKRNYGI